MRARAPGKVVISGAYAVLEGAPAIVAAVDRYAVADTALAPNFVTDEVEAALGAGPVPWIDASALREGGRKLGLGSSAAILVASLGAVELARDPALDRPALIARVFGPALSAHARAQGGGSGVDVASSTYGGVIAARRTPTGLDVSEVRLPDEVSIEILVAPDSASTRDLIRSVRALEARDPVAFAGLFGAQVEASERAAAALSRADAAAFIAALSDQERALSALGRAAGANIVTPELERLAEAARRVGAAALPAGAGGGDIALWVSAGAALPAELSGFTRLRAALGVPGLAALDPGS
jgi:phosphomevalonate kinase